MRSGSKRELAGRPSIRPSRGVLLLVLARLDKWRIVNESADPGAGQVFGVGDLDVLGVREVDVGGHARIDKAAAVYTDEPVVELMPVLARLVKVSRAGVRRTTWRCCCSAPDCPARLN
jgi:hypothetical protein